MLMIFLFLASSCKMTRQYYDFQHHGTDTIKTDSNFRYVARGVTGKAKTTYKFSTWKKAQKQNIVPNGLLSTAKSNLPELKDNQCFANMSIDILTTEVGMPTSGGMSIEELTIEVVVSADIIEYY